MVNIEDLLRQHQEVEAAAANGEVKRKKGYDNVKMEDIEEDFLSSKIVKQEKGKTEKPETLEKTLEKEDETGEKKPTAEKERKKRSQTQEPDKASVPTNTRKGSGESGNSKESTKTSSAKSADEPQGRKSDGSAKCCSIL